METPTPVSALLHAGIINAGGFLILRMSPVVALSASALDGLAVAGAVTALFGSVVMLAQSSIKVSLAWSTVAQMGFMMLQCGLGAFSAAALHIVAHALYKAHAFLSSGSVVDISKAAWTPGAAGKPHPFRLAGALAGAVALVFAVGALFGATWSEKPGALVLGSVLVMGVTQLLWGSVGVPRTPGVAARGIGLALAVCVAYFGLQAAFEWLLAGAVAHTAAARDSFGLGLMATVIGLFLTVLVLQSLAPYAGADPRWRAAFVHVLNGFYVNSLVNRLVQRVWPVRPEAIIGGAQQ